MMQVPRACLRADAIVSGGDISFVSFGTNDLTQVGASSPISTTATSTSTYTAPPHSHPAPAPRPPPPALCVACTSAAVRLLARRLERLLAGLRGAPPAGRRPLRLRGRARRRCSHAHRRAGTPLVPPVPLDPLRGPVAPTAPTATHIPSAAAPCPSRQPCRKSAAPTRRARLVCAASTAATPRPCASSTGWAWTTCRAARSACPSPRSAPRRRTSRPSTVSPTPP